jgi:hypothetical protein
VFLNATVFAFAPNYPSSSNNTSGTYAGVLTPTVGANVGGAGAPSLGIFAIGIPGSTAATVISQGAGVLFSSGAGYNMTITGVFDPSNSTLTAILDGVSNFTVTVNITDPVTGTVTMEMFNIFAEGGMTATIQAPNTKQQVTGAGTAGALQITGKASLSLFSSVSLATGPNITSTISFTVNGFQQNSTYSVPTLSVTSVTQP